jgi:transposase-like protein
MGKPSKLNPKCPFCKSQTISDGIRKNKQRIIQKYQCTQCKKYFTHQPNPQQNKTYNLKTILNSISNYNLGKPLRKQPNKIPSSTLHNWIKNINLPMNRLRNKIKNQPTYNIIIKKRFIHHNQPFLYQYHNLKLEFAKKFPGLINYLKLINNNLPKQIFNKSERISQIAKETPTTWVKTRVQRKNPLRSSDFSFASRAFAKQTTVFEPNVVVGVSLKEKQNYAVQLAKLAAAITKDNKQRHNIIENFMLINDTATIATEIPIYLKEEETNQNDLTGHIDILQLRFHKLYILDYKPEPINKEQTINQLRLYRKALSKRTNIKKYKIKLAFFNDKGYYRLD